MSAVLSGNSQVLRCTSSRQPAVALLAPSPSQRGVVPYSVRPPGEPQRKAKSAGFPYGAHDMVCSCSCSVLHWAEEVHSPLWRNVRREAGMPRSKKRTPKVEQVRPHVEGVAKNLVEKLYGPDGPPWGTKLTEIEDLLLALREVLTEKMLDEALARQAAARAQAPAALRCPTCQQPLACDGA